MQGDTCFHCHQQGHWARHCPFKSPLKKSLPSTSTPTSTSNGPNVPLLRCRCDLGYCLVRVSHTERNPDRKFYTCPGVNVRILLSQFRYFFLIWVLLGFQFFQSYFFFFGTFYRVVTVGSLSGVTKSQMVKIASLLCVHVALESVKGLR